MQSILLLGLVQFAALPQQFDDRHGVAMADLVVGLEPVGDLGRPGVWRGEPLVPRQLDELVRADTGLLFDIGEIGGKAHCRSLCASDLMTIGEREIRPIMQA